MRFRIKDDPGNDVIISLQRAPSGVYVVAGSGHVTTIIAELTDDGLRRIAAAPVPGIPTDTYGRIIDCTPSYSGQTHAS